MFLQYRLSRGYLVKMLFSFVHYSDSGKSTVRIEYINPFVESSINVLKEVLGVEVRRGIISLRSVDEYTHGVATIVHFHGDFRGHVVLNMSEQTAIALVSLMLENMQMDRVEELDEMARATITELANMITGRSVTQLSKLGFEFDLTPPHIMIGKEVKITNAEATKALVVPMILPMGNLDVTIAMKEHSNAQ